MSLYAIIGTVLTLRTLIGTWEFANHDEFCEWLDRGVEAGLITDSEGDEIADAFEDAWHLVHRNLGWIPHHDPDICGI